MVKIYTKANCTQCRFTKMRMVQKGIPFDDVFVDVENDTETLQKLTNDGAKSFPVVYDMNDNLLFSGFMPSLIDKLGVENV